MLLLAANFKGLTIGTVDGREMPGEGGAVLEVGRAESSPIWFLRELSFDAESGLSAPWLETPFIAVCRSDVASWARQAENGIKEGPYLFP